MLKPNTNKKVNAAKIFIIAFITGLIFGAPTIHFYELVFHSRSGGSVLFVGDPLDNIYIATFFGFLYSFPLALGFFGFLAFGQTKNLLLFLVIPVCVMNLIWLLGGNASDWLFNTSISLCFGVAGMGGGYIVKKLLTKKHSA